MLSPRCDAVDPRTGHLASLAQSVREQACRGTLESRLGCLLMQVRAVGKQRLVLDLSCRKRKDKYYVVSTCHSELNCTYNT